MERNVAGQKLTLLVIDSTTGRPKTGDAANLTAYVTKDDGSTTALTDTSAAEVSSTNAPGMYRFDLTDAETDGIKLMFSGKSSTSLIDVVPLTVYTTPVVSNGRIAADIGSSTFAQLVEVALKFILRADPGLITEFSSQYNYLMTAIGGGDPGTFDNEFDSLEARANLGASLENQLPHYNANGGRIWYVAPVSGVLTTKVDSDTGTITTDWWYPQTQVGDTIATISWSGGSRSNMQVTAVDGQLISVDGGSGTALPNEGTIITSMTGLGASNSNPGTIMEPLASTVTAQAVSSEGDTIVLLHGIFRVAIGVGGPGRYYRGTNAEILVASSSGLNGDDRCEYSHFTITTTGTYGISISSKSDILIEHCVVTGNDDAILMNGAKNVRVRNCPSLIGNSDGVAIQGSCANVLLENNALIKTTGSIATGTAVYALKIQDSENVTVRSSVVEAARDIAATATTNGVGLNDCPGVLFENVTVNAAKGSATGSGGVNGILTTAGSAAIRPTIIGGSIRTSNAGGGGAVYDVNPAAIVGSMYTLIGTDCDSTKFTDATRINFLSSAVIDIQTDVDTSLTNQSTLLTRVPDTISLANIQTEAEQALAAYDAATGADLSSLGVSTTDPDQEPIGTANTWVLEKLNAAASPAPAKYIADDIPDRFAIDFRNKMASSEGIFIIPTPTFEIYSGTAGGITFSQQGNYGKQAKVMITPVTAGTYVIKCTVEKNLGGTTVGYATLVVQ